MTRRKIDSKIFQQDVLLNQQTCINLNIKSLDITSKMSYHIIILES
jgi:hypothetical protein